MCSSYSENFFKYPCWPEVIQRSIDINVMSAIISFSFSSHPTSILSISDSEIQVPRLVTFHNAAAGRICKSLRLKDHELFKCRDSLNDSLDEYLHLLLFVGVLRVIGVPNRLIGGFPL